MLTLSYSGSAYPFPPNGRICIQNSNIQRTLTTGEQLRFSHVDVQLYCTHLMLEIHRYATEFYYRFQC